MAVSKVRCRFPLAYVCILCLVLLLVNIFVMSTIKVDTTVSNPRYKHDETSSSRDLRTYVVYGRDVNAGYLRHVFEMLQLYGYKRTTISDKNQWDIMWAHDYPFKNLSSMLRNLQPHQKVNHFPGSGFITNKMDLSTSGLAFSPKAFSLPMEREKFNNHVSEHPHMKYVVKSNEHRGIKILEIGDIDFSKQGIFIQEYIDNPLLVDGYKFDIGVYTIITSLDPLRVYIYDGDALFRYCTEKYYPFDASKTEKYVIGDDYLPTWNVPSLKKYYTEMGLSMKGSFNAYMEEQGRDHKIIWKNIEEAIRVICIAKEPLMVNLLKSYKSKRNFFELMRFDFVVDADLNIFLMEVNMSPNLSSLHFRPNQLLYEQVLFNVFSLVGLGLPHRFDTHTPAVVAANNIVNPSTKCLDCKSCSLFECKLCLKCLTNEMMYSLKQSYVEHMNKKDCKRVFPCDWKQKAEKYGLKLSEENQLSMAWYQKKCEENVHWCC